MNIFLILITSFSFTFSLAAECKFSSNPTVIFRKDHELHQFWLEEDQNVFASKKMANSTSLQKYLNEVESKITDTNPILLLEKTYNDFMGSGNAELILETPNMSLILARKAGVLYSANCLESLVLSQQTERGLSWNNPMEFSSFILKRSQGSKSFLKIYYSTNDRPGGRLNSLVMDLIQKDLIDGWMLLNHLHNHTFNTAVSDKIILVGAPSPSLSDVDLYRQIKRSLNLKSASVTNGIDTLYIHDSEFSIFQTR
jgi:hypothetical protein